MLSPTKNHLSVWRKVGTRYETTAVVSAFKSGNASLCIFGMFSSHGRSPLVRISGTLNQFKYIEILRQYVLPFRIFSILGIWDFCISTMDAEHIVQREWRHSSMQMVLTCYCGQHKVPI